MAALVIGATITGLAALFLCTRRASRPKVPLSEILVNNKTVSELDSREALDALIAQGGKAVIYLTACARGSIDLYKPCASTLPRVPCLILPFEPSAAPGEAGATLTNSRRPLATTSSRGRPTLPSATLTPSRGPSSPRATCPPFSWCRTPSSLTNSRATTSARSCNSSDKATAPTHVRCSTSPDRPRCREPTTNDDPALNSWAACGPRGRGPRDVDVGAAPGTPRRRPAPRGVRGWSLAKNL